ncbi:DUF2357 domain-containing protein [bacterium]|nr:DUF2357 domain-containing protein [bacterium]
MAKAKTNYEKRFYQRILKAINREDAKGFYKEFNNAIKSGKMTISQMRTKSQLSFDATWINVITSYLPYLEKIVRNPRIYMEAIEMVTPIQSAKKITARSVQHLSANVQNVQEIRSDGTIVPSKVLSTIYEDTMNIYENRFIMTLISKLAAFVEVRYEQIAEKTESYQTDYLRVQDVFKWRNYDIEANIDLKVKEQVEDEESQKNLELVEDIRTIRSYVRGFMQSVFYQTMKESRARAVNPPILRTNIIVKSVEYNSCLKLWQFLDSYRQLGVSVGVFDKELDFDEDFVNKVSDMLMLNYSLITENQADREDTYNLLPYKKRREKEIRFSKTELVVEEMLDEDADIKAVPPTISEYYYQRMKQISKTNFTRQVNSGISYNRSFLNIYKKMLKIENGVQKEILQGLEKRLRKRYPTKIKSAAKVTFLKRVRSIYKSVILIKKADLESAEAKLRKAEADLEKNMALIKPETKAFRKKEREKAARRARKKARAKGLPVPKMKDLIKEEEEEPIIDLPEVDDEDLSESELLASEDEVVKKPVKKAVNKGEPEPIDVVIVKANEDEEDEE